MGTSRNVRRNFIQKHYLAPDLVLVVYLAVAWPLARWSGFVLDGLWLYNLEMLRFIVVDALVLVAYVVVRSFLHDFRCWPWRARRARDGLARPIALYLNRRALLRAVHTYVVVLATQTIYYNFKQFRPLVNPREWDRELEAIDAAVHFGHSPRLISREFFSADWYLGLVDNVYILWLVVISFSLPVIYLWHRDQRARAHFFASYCGLWAAGGMLGVLIPSLGPCYTYPETYQGLNLPNAKVIQSKLMEFHQEFLRKELPATASVSPAGAHAAGRGHYRLKPFVGIAAMPSLHVAMIFLFVLFSFPINRPLGWMMLAYCLIIELGSVHTGWHYAIDGYVGALLALGVFLVTRRLCYCRGERFSRRKYT